ncbi:uncharacterized protein [Nicotiana sylvestris]|uniref:uncharacterized protein n=1 Tax=Nicotiana sylvestris TaxID=4096 RepID=UPI00388CDF63
MSAPWPFVASGMDVIGPIKPATSNGHRFILVAIDYFTMWAEAKTFKSVTKKAVVDFVHSKTIYRFGISKVIITDNGANLNSYLMTETWATHYLLVYGTEALIPAEIEIPSLRIVAKADIDDVEWVKTRLEQLSLIDENRLAAVCHGQLYKQKMARGYNKKAEAKGKFAPNWQGPFVVTRVLSNGTLYLIDVEGKCVEMAINSDAVKKYYMVRKHATGDDQELVPPARDIGGRGRGRGRGKARGAARAPTRAATEEPLAVPVGVQEPDMPTTTTTIPAL